MSYSALRAPAPELRHHHTMKNPEKPQSGSPGELRGQGTEGHWWGQPGLRCRTPPSAGFVHRNGHWTRMYVRASLRGLRVGVPSQAAPRGPFSLPQTPGSPEKEKDGFGDPVRLGVLAFQVWSEGLQQVRVQLLGFVENEQGLPAAALRPSDLLGERHLHTGTERLAGRRCVQGRQGQAALRQLP